MTNMLTILSFLALLATATASALLTAPTPTATPALGPTSLSNPSPTIAKRCTTTPCGGPGGETTLSPTVVTVMTTTAVPCYITSWVTNSTTLTSTVWSTETITSTVSEEGTIYVYYFSPTPMLMSSVYKSVLEITETFTSWWSTEEGSSGASTSTGPTMTISGGSSGNTSSAGYDAHTASPAISNTTSVWNHTQYGSASPAVNIHAADDAAGITTIGAKNAVAVGADGWSTAVSSRPGAVNAAATGSPMGSNVKWSAAKPRALLAEWRLAFTEGAVVGTVLIFELGYALR